MVLSNDTRGWIMTAISGVACVLGASIICADIIIRKFPGKRDFRIQDSDSFLSASLSLSFGVMLFSALYKMLPSAKESLEGSGMDPKIAAWILLACFIGGAVGIQVVSRVLHHYIPHNMVDCEHTHDEEEQKEHSHHRSHSHSSERSTSSDAKKSTSSTNDRRPATTPSTSEEPSYFSTAPGDSHKTTAQLGPSHTEGTQRPTLQTRLTKPFSKLSSNPSDGCKCASNGACYGYSEPCGQECFKIVQARKSFRGYSARSVRRPSKLHQTREADESNMTESTPLLSEANRTEDTASRISKKSHTQHDHSSSKSPSKDQLDPSSDSSTLTPHDHTSDGHNKSATSDAQDDQSNSHHHHVPTNAFLSIGLQTSIAIALHKLPEGFITYATNHANPKLGFSVFLALFIHNITEGFAMALPLYLAIQSRWKAMFWSSILGGFSQPLGAAVAAIWFKLAGNSDMAPGEGVYGGMFAVTAGIMASVALQLFSESLDLTHNRNLCMVFAFVGMGIMGVSTALTA